MYGKQRERNNQICSKCDEVHNHIGYRQFLIHSTKLYTLLTASMAIYELISSCNIENLCLRRECQQTLFGKKTSWSISKSPILHMLHMVYFKIFWKKQFETSELETKAAQSHWIIIYQWWIVFNDDSSDFKQNNISEENSFCSLLLMLFSMLLLMMLLLLLLLLMMLLFCSTSWIRVSWEY